MIQFRDVLGKSMTEIRNGAYYRCFGNDEVAQLLSRVQSLIIKNGYELENIVIELTKDRHIDDLDDFLSHQIMPLGTFLATKKVIKDSQRIQGQGIEPDFLIFRHEKSSQMCYVIELKDGHEFDTKSSAKEQANLHQFIKSNADALKFFQIYAYIVGFNAISREEVRTGFKNKIELKEAMTGEEFCHLIDLDYQIIREKRAQDRVDNMTMTVFVEELLNITELRSALISRINSE